MIGRFSNVGSYRELLNIRDVARVLLGGILALVGYLWNTYVGIGAWPGTMLILTSVGVNGLPIIWGAIEGLRKKKVNVDELVSLAIVASLIAGEFLSAAVVSFVMVLGSIIEEAAGESARKAIRSLIKLTPDEATILYDDHAETRPIEAINVGDILMVKPGDRIPVDAVIVDGTAAIDESSITGEPIPVEKTKKDEVYSGTLNQNGLIKIRATKIGNNTTLGKIIQLITEAEAHHPKSVTLIDKYAGWFTPAIVTCAGVAWLLTGDLNRTVAVLIVGCPCALILAAPTATVAAISKAAREGILIKGGQYIENAALANTVLFDKTGTLTVGEPHVDNVYSSEKHESNYVLRQAACVEQNSTHPLARAVMKAAQYAKVSIQAAEDLMSEIGLGVRGCVDGCSIEVGSAYMGGGGSAAIGPPLKKQYQQIIERGATPLIVYQNRKSIGIISVTDSVRSEAKKTLERLKGLGVKTLGILSGDHPESVQRVKRAVGASHAWAELKPKDKLDIISALRNSVKDGKLIFVGDGINDAPALAAADVGIAMGAKGTEVALETADIALMNDDISKIPFLIRLGRRMILTIKMNIAFGLGFNVIAVLAIGSGWLTPIMGAVVHNIGSVFVVLASASIALHSSEP